MATRAKSWAFVLALGLSLALLLPLVCGYVGRTGFGLRWRSSGSPPVYRWAILTAEEGRVRLWLEAGPPPRMAPGVVPGMVPSRWSVQWYPVWPMRAPDLRRAVWGFDAHRLGAVRNAFIFAFPSWCAIVICLIAPGVWLARRRPRGEGHGFSVVQVRAVRPKVPDTLR